MIKNFIFYLLKIIAKKLVIQGWNHKIFIKKYLSIMYVAMQEEFTEDNDISLQFYLREMLEKVFEEAA